MFERFTDRARRVLVLAQEEARLLNHSFMGTEHILLGLIGEEKGVAAVALERCGISLEAARHQVEEIVGSSPERLEGSPQFTPRAKRVLELSLREALQLSQSYIGTEHILLGLIREGEGVGAKVIQRLGVALGQLHQEVIALMAGTAEDVGEDDEGRAVPAHGDPPRCSRCRAGLSEEARYKVIEVPPDQADADAGTFSVRVVFCKRCGTALGTA